MRSAVSADFATILSTENSQLEEQARKEVALSIDSDVKSKDGSDHAAGRGAASSSQASGRGRGRGSGSDVASMGAGPLPPNFSRSPFLRAWGFMLIKFMITNFRMAMDFAPKSKLIPIAEIRARMGPPQNYGARLQANAPLRPNGRGQAGQ